MSEFKVNAIDPNFQTTTIYGTLNRCYYLKGFLSFSEINFYDEAVEILVKLPFQKVCRVLFTGRIKNIEAHE